MPPKKSVTPQKSMEFSFSITTPSTFHENATTKTFMEIEQASNDNIGGWNSGCAAKTSTKLDKQAPDILIDSNGGSISGRSRWTSEERSHLIDLVKQNWKAINDKESSSQDKGKAWVAIVAGHQAM